MKKFKKRPLFFIIISVVLLLIAAPFTNIFTKAHANDGSTIAGIAVGAMTEDDIRSILNEAIVSWSQNPPMLEGGGSTMVIDPASFEFNVEATITTYKALTDKPWYAFWESDHPVHIPLEVTNGESLKGNIEAIGSWNVEETYALAVQNISNLKTEAIEAVVLDTSILESERLTFIIQDIPENAKSIYDIVMFLDGTVIGAGENFSLLAAISSLANNSNVEGLSFVGSLLYRNALYTNTTITERHRQQEIPAYLEPGLEAYVNVKTAKDVSFTNNGSEPIKMTFAVSGQQLKVEFLSSVKSNTVTVHIGQAGEVEPRRIIRFTDDLAVGAQRVLRKGEKGARVTVFRAIDGFEEQMSRDYYPPTNEVILKSSRQPEPEEAPDGTVAPDGTISPDGTTPQDGTILPDGTTPSNGTSPSGQGSVRPSNPEDTIDLDNDGLPDINQGDGYGPKVDSKGNVVQPDGTTTDKAGNSVTKGGSK